MSTQKNTSSKASGKKLTKSGFIRTLPASTPAEEVIAKGKEAGLELKKKLVWNTQSEMRAGATGGPAKKPGPKPRAASAGANAAQARVPTAVGMKPKSKGKGKKKPATKKATLKSDILLTKSETQPSVSAENKMKALIVQLGTTRAEQVYRAVKTQLDAIASGA